MTLSLNGQTIPNEGDVLASDIGEGGDGGTGMNDGGLLCITNRIECCRGADNPNGGAQGYWYFPNGNAVGIRGDHTTGDFFYRNRDARIVRLNRFGTSTPPERGRFSCVVPNATGDMMTVYVNIGECHRHKLWTVKLRILYPILFHSSGPATSYTSTHRASYDYHQ